MFKEFIEKVLSHSKVAVFSHVRPDGDCIGSQVALSLWLQKNGVEVSAFNEDDIPENMKWMTDFFPVQKPKEAELSDFDAFIVVDGNALFRFGEIAQQFPGTKKPVYMIDHHPDPEPGFEVSVSVESSSSTCELVYKLYAEHDPGQIDTGPAKSMYAGIVTDTASFQFESVSPDTMKAASVLLEKGNFTPDEVVEEIYSTRPVKQLKLLSLALGTISQHANKQIATICVTKEMMDQTNTTKEDTEGFVAYPLSLKGTKACVLFREDGDNIKLSLRSRSHIDVNKWARKLGGGGHKRAAGAWHEGPLEKAIEEVIKIGEEQLTNE